MALVRLSLGTVHLFEDEEAGSTRMGLYVTVSDDVRGQVAEFRWNRRNGEVEDNFAYPLDGDRQWPSVLTFDIGGAAGGVGKIAVRAYTDNDEQWPSEAQHENFLGAAEVLFDTREPSQLGELLIGPTVTDEDHTGYAVTARIELVPEHRFRRVRLSFADLMLINDENAPATHVGLYVNVLAPAQGGADLLDRELLRWNNEGRDVSDETLYPLAAAQPSPVVTVPMGGPTVVWAEVYTHDDESFPGPDAYENFLGRVMFTVDPADPATIGARVLGPAQTDETHNGYLLSMSSELLPVDDAPDLEITGIEVTQAIQRFTPPTGGDAPVPLAAARTTLVRVYLDSGLDPREDFGMIDGVTGTLTLNGGAYTAKEFSPMTARPVELLDRGVLSHTLNFLVPGQHVPPGRATFRVQARVRNTVSNIKEVTADIHPTRPVNIWMVRVEAGQVPPPTEEQYLAVSDALPTVFPIASDPAVGLVYWTLPGSEVIHTSRDLTEDGDRESFIDDLEDIQEDHGNDDQLMYAMLGDAVPTGRLTGQARFDDHVAFGRRERTAFAHEMAHLFDLDHAPCGDGIEYIDRHFVPPSGRTGEWGVDLHTPIPTLRSPDVGDLMSYCDGPRRWISPYHWTKLLSKLSTQLAPLADEPPRRTVFGTVPPEYTPASRPFPGPVIRVRGRLTRSDAVRWQPCVRTFREPSAAAVAAAAAPTPGYTVVLEDAAGRELATAPTRVAFHSTDQQEASFGARLPYEPAAHRVVLRRDGAELGALTVPPGPPVVALLEPAALPQIDTRGILHLRWRLVLTPPPDGGPQLPVTYFVRFSNADGTFALRPGVNLTGDSFDLDLRELPGHKRCVVQVIATNGYHTSYVQTPPFTLPLRAPRLLLAATDGPVLRVQGSSPQRGPLTGDALTWEVDGLPVAATGGSFDVRVAGPGVHAVAVRATDPDGLTTTMPLGDYDGSTGLRPPPPPGR